MPTEPPAPLQTTTTITGSVPLGQLVAAHPQTASVLEGFGLDYCCGGSQPLGEACRKAGLEAATVLSQLEAALAEPSPERDWMAATMSELVDNIEQTHHEYLRRELPRLAGLLRKVVAAHGDRRPELAALQTVFAGFSAELTDHMLKEERMLFPWIRRLESGAPAAELPGWSVTGPVACMMHEHDDASEAMTRIGGFTRGYTPPADACGTYRALYAGLAELERDMHRHVHKENSILFPKAINAETAAARAGGPASGANHTMAAGLPERACSHGCDHRSDS